MSDADAQSARLDELDDGRERGAIHPDGSPSEMAQACSRAQLAARRVEYAYSAVRACMSKPSHTETPDGLDRRALPGEEPANARQRALDVRWNRFEVLLHADQKIGQG